MSPAIANWPRAQSNKGTEGRTNGRQGEGGMKRGQMDSAIRRALNIFDAWNDVTGYFVKHSGYYYEIQSLIEDAVHCGAQEALGVHGKLESEPDGKA